MSEESSSKILKKMHKAVINGFGNEQIACGLLRLGIKPNMPIELVRQSPFGGVYYVKIGSQLLALRENELNNIRLR